MKHKGFRGPALGLGLLVAASPLSAHHSFAADRTLDDAEVPLQARAS